jgi:hypothetical protein
VGKFSLKEIVKYKAKLTKTSCSSCWVDAVCYEGKTFPPKAETTPMPQCIQCNCFFPMYYITNGLCEDCRLGNLPKHIMEQLPSSNLASLLRSL